MPRSRPGEPLRALARKPVASGGSDEAAEASQPTPPEQPGAAPGLFGPDDDNDVRGELILKLTAAGGADVTESIPTGPLGARAAGTATPSRLGVAGVDAVLAKLKVRAISHVHPPMPEAARAMAEDRALGDTYRVRLDEGADLQVACDKLMQAGEVAAAEPNRWREATVLPNDPGFAAQWNLARIGCPAAWDVTRGSRNVVVAVVDSGVDLDHPELAPLLLPGQDMVDLAGTSPPPGTHFEGDWIQRDDQPQDEVGHGTHVAGTIAAASNEGFGVAGVNWQCSLLPVKVLTRVVENQAPNRVRGIGSSADIAAGIRWAVDHGAQVINLSLGGYRSTFVEQEAVAYAVSRGVIVVAAMGNDNVTTPAYPAAFPDVIAVGATDANDQRASFSNTGAHIDLAAPGVDIMSTDWNDSHGTKSGTSMACPHVAGVAALVLACDPSLTAQQVRQILRETAQPLRDEPNDPIPNERYGHGLLDAAAAVARAGPQARPLLPVFPITRTTMPTLPPPTLPNFTRTPMTRPTLPTFPTRPTLTQPTITRPTSPTFPTNPTNPTFPTRPTLTQPTLTRPTLTRPTLTRPTLPTFPTRPTLTQPTITRPTLTQPTITRPTSPTFPTNPTNPTFPTRPTLTQPTITRPTLTRPTLTQPTITRPTLTQPTLTRPTLTQPTLTRPTLTRPTLTQPTITRPTITVFTRPTVGTRPPGTFVPVPGFESGAYEGYNDPYAAYYAMDPYAYAGPYAAVAGMEGYYDPYAGYAYGAYEAAYDPNAGWGYEAYAEDPYAANAAYAGYADPYAAYYADPYAAYYADPYAVYGYEAGAYDRHAATGMEGGYYDPYATGGYEASYDPYGTLAAYYGYGDYGAFDPNAGG